ncbi:MAG: DUF1338 domain-containing protein [Flavobacteriales bacterium]|nr:DUF1338 domain-containing protein [Flavobacteriales bacterium]
MNSLINQLWSEYVKITPSAKIILQILELESPTKFTDHIVFRSIGTGKNGIRNLCLPFIELGYHKAKTYYCEEKKVNAIHLENIKEPHLPKVFISELILEGYSDFLVKEMKKCSSQLDQFSDHDLPTAGRTWEVDLCTYKQLEEESEYAAWIYIHGSRVNQFTLSVNELKDYSLEILCFYLKNLGIVLNQEDGVIKGHAEQGLKQASTIPDRTPIYFKDIDAEIMIPSSCIAFAERFFTEGELFTGFITESANLIFDSIGRKAS